MAGLGSQTRRELAHPAGLPPANSPFEAEDDNDFTTDAEMGPMERLALSWGKARQFTKLVLSLLSHIGKLVGRHGFAPCSRRVRTGTSLSKFATRSRREGGVEPPQPDLWSPDRHRDFASRKMDGHVGSAPTIPVWKTGVCLSTLMPDEMESRARVTLA